MRSVEEAEFAEDLTKIVRTTKRRGKVIRMRGVDSNLPFYYISEKKLIAALGGDKKRARDFVHKGSQMQLRCAWHSGSCEVTEGPIHLAVPTAGGSEEPLLRRSTKGPAVVPAVSMSTG
jgi:hypothetical protein